MSDEEAPKAEYDPIADFSWGVAHDFSNLVQVILGFAELIKAQNRDDPALQDSMDEILTASKRASAMVKQLLVIGRRRVYDLQPVALSDALGDAAPNMQGWLGSEIKLVRPPDAPAALVRVDPQALSEVLHVLCAHARESMPKGGAVTASISVESLRRLGGRSRPPGCGTSSAGGLGRTKPARYVRLSLQDTGSGFDPALAAQFFEPYFAKRRLKRGRGLELAVARTLIEEHGGWIDVETAPTGGSTFHLYFPQAAEQNGTDLKR